MKRTAFLVFAVGCGLALGLGCGPDPDEFLRPATATIKGTALETVTTPPTPRGVAAARVTLENANNAPAKGFLGPFFAGATGGYLVPNIPPGIYDVVLDKIVGTPAQPLRGRVRFITLSGGDERIIRDLVLRPPGVLAGRVLLGGAPADGNAGITVSLEGTTRTTTTNGAGAWQLPDLESAVTASGDGAVYTIVFQKAGFVEDSIPGLDLISGQRTNVATTTLEPLSPQTVAAIRGKAVVEPRDAAAGDHGGVTVTVEGTSRSVVTTPGGFFEFANLPLALYTLRLERTDTFTRRVSGIVLRAGQTVNNIGTIQLDTHRTLAPAARFFDLEHSPNGTQVAFIDGRGEIGVMDSGGQIFRQNLTQSARAAFDARTGLGRGLSWSPDGTEILFVRSEGFASLPFRLAIVPSAGGAVRTVLTSGNEYYTPAWATDGKAFSYYLTPNLRRVDVSRDSLGRSEPVTSTDRIVSGSRPPGPVSAVSALEAAVTGRLVYSFATSATSNGIFSAFALGGVDPIDVVPRLPDGRTLVATESPTFAPDASRIAFSLKSADAALTGIYLMNLDGSGATRLTTRPGNNLDFSPDGRRILFTNPEIGSSRLGELTEVLVPR